MSEKHWFVMLLTFTAIVRGTVVGVMPTGLDQDRDAYRAIAETLRTTGTYGFSDADGNIRPTAFRPPLYPILLAAMAVDGKVLPIAIAVLHVALGVMTVGFVWKVARAWQLGNWSWLAAVLTACDPLLLNQSCSVMTETLATMFAILALEQLTRLDERQDFCAAVLAGTALGLAALCRPTFVPWGLAVVLASQMRSKTRWRKSVATCTFVALLAVLLPWGVRNWLTMGEFKLTTTHGGYTLLLGNNPDFYRWLRDDRTGVAWRSADLDHAWSRRAELRDEQDDLFQFLRHRERPEAATVIRTEFADDRLAYAFAQRFIREEPAMFARAAVSRVGWLWHVLPQRVDANESTAHWFLRVATAAWYLGLFAAAIVGAFNLRDELWRGPWRWGLLLCLTFTAVHLFFWSNLRMRAPLMPFVTLLAAAAFIPRRSPRDR